MPVEFLSDEQAAGYGRFTGEPSRAELERFFFLDDADQALTDKRRGDHNRLGFALQMGTVRFLGTFLPDPLDVPWPVVEYLATQLGVADVSAAKRYAERLPTQHEHAREIRQAYGYRDLSDATAAAGLQEFLERRAWTHAEGPYRLFGQAVGWLRRNRVLLPGVSVLARLVASVRDGAAERMYRSLAAAAAAADPALPSRLQQLLQVPEGQRVSEQERLRAAPRRTSGRAMTIALDRVCEVVALGACSAHVEAVPANRLAALARYGLAAKAPALRDLTEPRRTATLLATAQHLEAAAVDDALDLFDVLMATRLIGTAQPARDQRFGGGVGPVEVQGQAVGVDQDGLGCGPDGRPRGPHGRRCARAGRRRDTDRGGAAGGRAACGGGGDAGGGQGGKAKAGEDDSWVSHDRLLMC